MNKKFIISKNEEISKIIKTGQKINFKYIYIYRKENEINNNRFCVSVSKKLGNAVIRNKLKRQVKDILMKNNVENNYDYVIILSSLFKDLDYVTKKQIILKMLEEK